MSERQHGSNRRAFRPTPSLLKVLHAPLKHAVNVIGMDGEHGWLLLEVKWLCFFNLNVHRLCVLRLMADGQIEKHRPSLDGHLVLSSHDGVFVCVPSMSTCIKNMAQTVANPTGAKSRDRNGFVGVSCGS